MITIFELQKALEVDAHTRLIDSGLSETQNTCGNYYIIADKTFLLDSGVPKGAQRIIRFLRKNKLPFPDIIGLTHPHWDHSQGIPIFAEEAEKLGKKLRIVASVEGAQLLKDQSWNACFGKDVPTANINHPIETLQDGEYIDLGTTKLKIIYTPGHCKGHVCYFDETAGNLFVGDMLGVWINENAFLPPTMPPFWNEDEFTKSLQRIKKLKNVKRLCLNHYGYIQESNIADFYEKLEFFFNVFRNVYIKGKDNSLSFDMMRKMILEEAKLTIPVIELFPGFQRSMLNMVNKVRTMMKKKPIKVSDIMYDLFLKTTYKGYHGLS